MIALHTAKENEVVHVNRKAILAIRGQARGSTLEIACRAGSGRIEVYHVREAPEDILTKNLG